MVYTILISIVFIAELIILTAAITSLLRVDKIIISLNETVDEAKPKIKDVSELTRKISEQIVELSEDFVGQIKAKQEDTLIKHLNKILIAVLLWKLNSKTIKRIRRSKFAKNTLRAFALLQSMV